MNNKSPETLPDHTLRAKFAKAFEETFWDISAGKRGKLRKSPRLSSCKEIDVSRTAVSDWRRARHFPSTTKLKILFDNFGGLGLDPSIQKAMLEYAARDWRGMSRVSSGDTTAGFGEPISIGDAAVGLTVEARRKSPGRVTISVDFRVRAGHT